MRIIFVRHVPAKMPDDGSAPVPDADRTVAARARALFNKNIRKLNNQLDFGGARIWSGPDAGAKLTAKLLAAALNLPEPECHAFILDGTYEDLVAQLGEIKELDSLFIVGAEPNLSRWSAKISGVRPLIDEGGLFALCLDSLDPLKGRPIGRSGTRIEGDPETAEQLDFTEFRDALLDQINTIQERLAMFEANPSDLVTTHQFRVSIRVARSLLSFAGPLFSESEYHVFRERLKVIGGQFGYLRELDVLLEQWSDFVADVAGRTTLSYYLMGRRKIEERKVIHHVDSISISNELDMFQTWLENQPQDSKEDFESFADRRFTAWNRRALKVLRALNYREWSEVHALRIRYKKIRYVQRAFPCFDRQSILSGERLKEMQDDLGRICDTYVNTHILRTMFSDPDFQQSKNEASRFIDHLKKFREELELKMTLSEWETGR